MEPTATISLESLARLSYATVHGACELLTLKGATREERQTDAENRIRGCCAIMGLPSSASIEEYRAQLATWDPE